MRNEELLIRLTQTQGIAGYEKKVRELIEQEVRPYADELIVDPLGSLIAVKKGKGGPHSKKIMFAAHMDEIGFMVKKIEEDGRLLVCNVGWNWTASAYNTRVVFRNGIYGVVSSMKNIEDAHNDPNALFIDIGAKSKEDALKYVHVGSVCGYCGEYLPLANDLVCSKTFDDRVGCFQLIEALRELILTTFIMYLPFRRRLAAAALRQLLPLLNQILASLLTLPRHMIILVI